MQSSLTPEIKEKARLEIQETILKPSENSKDLKSQMTYENVGELKYLSKCFMEVLRLDPPVPMASFACLNQTVEIGGVLIDKDQPFVVDHRNMGVDPDQWQQPRSFIPERFDSTSLFYAKPDGGKRHPMAWTPFLGGKRICLGKTFAEVAAKYLWAMLIYNFDFEFVNQEQKDSKPPVNAEMVKFPVVPMKITRAHYSK